VTSDQRVGVVLLVLFALAVLSGLSQPRSPVAWFPMGVLAFCCLLGWAMDGPDDEDGS
jgi:hypothetical protein